MICLLRNLEVVLGSDLTGESIWEVVCVKGKAHHIEVVGITKFLDYPIFEQE